MIVPQNFVMPIFAMQCDRLTNLIVFIMDQLVQMMFVAALRN